MKYFKSILSGCCILLSYVMNAQSAISVEYKEWSPLPENIPEDTPIHKLIIYPHYSVYFHAGFIKNNQAFSRSHQDEYEKINDALFKFYPGKRILFLSPKINKNYFVVSDSLNLMKWKIQKSKPIRYLGLDCYEAKTQFRGRNYTAYFAPKIKKSDGPFKFSGLPGLIIKIAADDNFNIWQAVKINFHDTKMKGMTIKFKEKPIPFHAYARLQKMEDKREISDLKKRYPDTPGLTSNYEFPHLEKNLQL